MNYLTQALREHQELAVFLTLAIGFFIGRLRIGSFSLGTVVGTLLAGVAIGQLNIQVPAVVKYVFFDLFLFTTGYKVGPQFFRGLKKDALPQVALTVVLCVICLFAAFTAAQFLGYDMGTAAGLPAGAFTESTAIGTAGRAIGRLARSDAVKLSLSNNIPLAYAVTYLVGTAFIVWFLPNVGPKLMGVNLKEEARKLQAKISGSGSAQAEAMSAFMRLAVRAYRITRSDLLNRSVAELESRPREARVFISRIRRDGKIIEPEPDTVVCEGDFVGAGIFLGGILGLSTIVVGGLPLTLTASGGALIMGLVFGWLRAVRPTFGRIPESAMWVFDTVGLTVFMACVGLAAGPSFFSGLQKSGLSLVLVGLIIAVLPHAVAILFGRYVLKMNPVIVLGACSGAGTITAALRAIQEEAQRELPALGYTVPYAIGNILLTAWGPVLVAMMS